MEKILDEIFKAYDIRGKVGTELQPQLIEKVGFAFSKWLPNDGPVAIGRDMRPDSQELAEALIRGINSAGREAIDIGEVTSDMIYFATGNLELAGGAMITASHNPGEYNGIKFCREEAKPVGQDSGLFEIRDQAKLLTDFTATSNRAVTEKDVTTKWVEHVLSFIDKDSLKPLRIAADAGNGMAGKILPHLEKFLPFEVHKMFYELDGTFPNHIANPLEEKNLIDIKKAIAEKNLDAGIAFDGDGDRAVLIDENGVALSGTVMTALLADYFLKKNPGAIILCNAICGQAAIDTINRAGGTAIRTRVGHSFIKGDMRKHNALFAGEHSGHYYFKDNFMADSGLIAATIALSILSNSGKKLSELVAPYREAFVSIEETNFTVEDKQAVIGRLSSHFANHGQEQLDGLTVRFPKGWFNVRPSNTEPLLRLNAEASDSVSLEEIVGQAKAVIAA